jgi:hypothetical protein
MKAAGTTSISVALRSFTVACLGLVSTRTLPQRLLCAFADEHGKSSTQQPAAYTL